MKVAELTCMRHASFVWQAREKDVEGWTKRRGSMQQLRFVEKKGCCDENWTKTGKRSEQGDEQGRKWLGESW